MEDKVLEGQFRQQGLLKILRNCASVVIPSAIQPQVLEKARLFENVECPPPTLVLLEV